MVDIKILVLRKDDKEKVCIQVKIEGKQRKIKSLIRFINKVKDIIKRSVVKIMKTAED